MISPLLAWFIQMADFDYFINNLATLYKEYGHRFLVIKNEQVLGAYPSSSDFLIGMDVIGLGDFAVTNYLNQTAFSFRLPSQERLDFTIV